MHYRSLAAGLTILFAAVLVLLIGPGQALADTNAPNLPMEVPVLVVKYFPAKGDRIDQSITGDWGASLEGADNGLSYHGKPLTNWWIFIGDFDDAMRRKMKMVAD